MKYLIQLELEYDFERQWALELKRLREAGFVVRVRSISHGEAVRDEPREVEAEFSARCGDSSP